MKGMGNIQKMMKQAKEMQERLQKEMAKMRVEGSSGGGMVTVVLDGSKNLISLTINPEVVDKEDTEMLQDLILSATNEALKNVQEMVAAEMSKLTGGLNIPGLM